MKRLFVALLALISLPAFAQFSPGTILTATALNAALAAPAITAGSINGSTSIYTTGPVTLLGVNSLGAQTSATTQPYTDNSQLVATTAFTKRSILATTATIPMPITGGTYNFASAGSGAIFGVTTSSGAISGITSVVAGGTGYQVGDVLTMLGGNGDGLVFVSGVSGGAVSTATVFYGGTGYSGTPQLTGLPLPPGSRSGNLTGTLTSNATIIIPSGTLLAGARRIGFQNNTTGAFTVTVKLSNGAGGSTGTGVVLPQGASNSTSLTLYTNGTTDVWPEVSSAPNFVVPGTISAGSITLSSALAIASGGTGATTATGATSNLRYLQGASGSVARSVTSKLQERITPEDCGALGDGTTDDTSAVTACDAIASAAGVSLTLDRPYLVSGSPTFSANWRTEGGRVKWVGTGTVSVNGRVDASDGASLFDYPATAHLALNSALVARVPVGWLYGLRDGSLDVSRFMNDAIASAPASGREVFIPVGLWSLTAETVQIGMKNFITIRGANNGVRSNIEYQKAPPVGIGGSTQFPGGGSALQMNAGLATGIQVAAFTGSYATYRVSGLTLADFHLSGSGSATVVQNGIVINGATDGTVITGLSIINMTGATSIGLQLQNSDSPYLANLWINEVQYPVDLSGTSGIRGRMTGSSLGAINGDALALTNQSGWTFTNLSIVQGARNIVLTNSGFNTFTGLNLESLWTGMIVINSGLENVFSGVSMRCWPTSSSAVDPLGRTQASYGLVNLSAVSGGGDVSGTIFTGFDISNGISASTTGGAANPVTFNIGQGGDMLIGNGTIRNTASNQKIVVASAVTGLTLNKVAQSTETVVVGSAVVDANYKTIGKPVIASGFGTSPSIVDSNSANAFRINVGTGGTATNGTLTMPTVAHTWVCNIQDLTTHSNQVFQTLMSASTTSSVTITNYAASGSAAAWGSGDVLSVSCVGY